MDGFVLAGGAGKRMGFDKARASVEGWPTAVRVAEVVRTVTDRVALVRRGLPDGHPWSWRDGTPIEVVREADDGERHPLWGVATALRAARSEWVVVAPCDVPTLPGALLQALAASAPATVRDPSGPHPLIAVLPSRDADRAAELARTGRSVRDFVAPYELVAWPEVLPNLNRVADGIDRLEDLARSFAPLVGEDLRTALEAEAARRLATRGAWIPWSHSDR